MQRVEEYRRRAARIEREARRAASPEQERQFRLLAAAWRELAAEIESGAPPEARSFKPPV